ncbi:MAG TPA: YihY/virulence factor BrkB family protein [Terriglobales bacterium]|nr:YihY/virulence factor BrkB family protein [Terriglobales bacterium]
MTASPSTLWTKGNLTFFQLLKNVIRAIRDDDLVGAASGLAFNFLLAFFPALFFLLSLFGLFASRSAQLETRLMFYFAPILPPEAFHLLQTMVKELSSHSGGERLTISIVFALWFASGAITSMISTLNATYRVPDSRSWLKIHAIALCLTLVMSVFLLFALFTVLAGAHVMDWLGATLGLETATVFLWKAFQWPLAVAFLMFSFSLIYYFAADASHKRWHWITPGSLVGVLLWLAASGGFRLYLHYYDTYTRTYGSLGALMILVVWFYVTGFAFLVGREIDAEIGRASGLTY